MRADYNRTGRRSRRRGLALGNRLQNNENNPRLSIVIPAYNEERRIADTLETIARYLGAQPFSYEVLVVDDGSTDRTAELCRKFAAGHPWLSLLQCPANFGKGNAVREGVLNAVGEYVLFCDADLATPVEELDGFWPHINGGADIVIASRPIRGSHLVKRQPIYRETAGRAFNHVVQMLAVPGIHDTQCGFKLFTAEAAKEIFRRCTLKGFGFDFEALHIAQRLGYRIKEVPVRWYHREGSKVKLLRDGFRMLADLVRVRLRHRALGRRDG